MSIIATDQEIFEANSFSELQLAGTVFLEPHQQELVDSCLNDAVYIGCMSRFEHVVYWNLNGSDGFVEIPLRPSDGSPSLNWEKWTIRVTDPTAPWGAREFDTETGEEIPQPPFKILAHFDVRSCIAPKGARGSSIVPDRLATKLGLAKTSVEWFGSAWLDPWEFTEEISARALAITIELLNGKRIIVL